VKFAPRTSRHFELDTLGWIFTAPAVDGNVFSGQNLAYEVFYIWLFNWIRERIAHVTVYPTDVPGHSKSGGAGAEAVGAGNPVGGLS
jgi:hypothetical protein